MPSRCCRGWSGLPPPSLGAAHRPARGPRPSVTFTERKKGRAVACPQPALLLGTSGGDAPSRPAPAIFRLCGLGTSQFVAPRSTLPGIPGCCEPSLLCPHIPAAAQDLALTGADVPALWPWVSTDSDGEWRFLGPTGPRRPGRHRGTWALTRPSGRTPEDSSCVKDGPPQGLLGPLRTAPSREGGQA